MKKRWIPFRFLPASWGLRGQAYLEAEAAYYYEGEELEHRIVEIRNPHDERARKLGHLAIDHRYGHLDAYEYELDVLEVDGRHTDPTARLALDLRHARIEPYDHDVALAKVDYPEPTEQALALLEVDKAYERVTEREYDKRKATIKGEPWVGIVNDNFDLAQGLNGFSLEFDWNEHWIEYLRLNGYVGHTDEDVVDLWLKDVCRSIIQEGAASPDPLGA